MSNLLESTVIGRLGKDPELTYTPAGRLILECNVAVNTWTNGKKDDEPTWIVVTITGRQADTASELTDRGSLRKGTTIWARGDFRIRSYTTRAGERRFENKLYVDKFLLLGGDAT